jgi:hypothetical protein
MADLVWAAMSFIAAAVLGIAVGVAELISRYKDEPVKAILSVPAAVYLLINGGASATALAITRSFGWTFGVTDAGQVIVVQTAIAGLGAMGLFRSSLFTIRIAGQDIGAGPSALLQIALGAADKAVDKNRATARAAKIAELMSGISFDKAVLALPTFCLALMQNLTAAEQAALRNEVDKLARSTVDETTKRLTLGLSMLNLVGEKALAAAIKTLGEAIR